MLWILLCVHFLTKTQKMLQLGFCGHLLLRQKEIDLLNVYYFFPLVCISSSGRYSWSGLLRDGSITNKRGRLLPCTCRCALSLSQMHLCCLPPAARGREHHWFHATHTNAGRTHISADCQSPTERGDTTETNMSVPQAGIAIILSKKKKKSGCGMRKKKKTFRLLILTGPVFTCTSVCLYNPTEFVKKEPE